MKQKYVVITNEREAKVLSQNINEKIKNNEILIKCEYSMISAGTELSRYAGIKKTYPFLPGYCSVGKVIKVGKNIKDLKVNDLVYYNAPHASISIWSRDNKTQGKFIFKLDNKINKKHATIINLALVALQGVNLTNPKVNDTVAVFGLGNIGILTCIFYRKLGCNVIGIDPIKNRRQLASKFKIKTIPSIDKLKEKIDISVDVTGVSPAIIDATSIVKKYGEVLLLGSPRQAYETNITPLLSNIHMKNLKVIGAFNNTCPVYEVEGSDNSVEKNINRIIEMINKKEIDVEKLISHIISIKDINKAYTGLLDQKDKFNCVIIDWNKNN